jgi:hypothetical protein
MKRKVAVVRSLKQARAYILRVGICGIFSDGKVGRSSLWDVVDLPDRQPGEKGWGQKVIAIWRWKNELPALYPEEIFYGKIPSGHKASSSAEILKFEFKTLD